MSKEAKCTSLQVIVTVSGGVADVLFKSPGIALALYDYDVEGSDANEPGVSRDPDGQLCCIREWDPSEEIVGSETLADHQEGPRRQLLSHLEVPGLRPDDRAFLRSTR